MRTIHNLLDVNKDGIISYDDFKLLADKFVQLGHLPEKQQHEFYKIIEVGNLFKSYLKVSSTPKDKSMFSN